MPHVDSSLAEFRRTGYAQQAAVRVGIGLFMGIYFSLTEYITHPLYLSFVVYALGSYVLARSVWRSRISTWYLGATLFLDVSFTLLSLYVVEAYGYFLFLILIQICFGYGVRYGSSVLWAATFVVCAGILLIFLVSDYWGARPYEAISFFVGVPFLALYIHYLNNRLRKAKHRADTEAATNARLLRFVSHDMRTQLQALLYTTESVRQAVASPQVANAVNTIEETVHSLARISSSFARAPEMRKQTGIGMAGTSSPAASYGLGRWLGSLCGRFDALLRERDITLHVHFADQVPTAFSIDRVALERLLLNSISNAARFSSGGLIEIILESAQDGPNGAELTIRIRNHSPCDFQVRAVGEAGAAGTQLFFGAGLGLSINEDVAASLGGTFVAEASTADSFSCVLTLPGSAFADLILEPLATPVLCCSRNLDRVRTVRSILGDTCNVLGYLGAEDSPIPVTVGAERPAAIVLDETTASVWLEQGGDPLGQPGLARDCKLVLDGNPMWQHSEGSGTCVTAARATSSLINAVHFASAYNGHGRSIGAVLDGPTLVEGHFCGLYVEDGEFNARRLVGEAENAGWALEHALGVDEAIGKLQNRRYDFVLMDWELGDTTALDVLDSLAGQNPSFRTPIFILSAHGKPEIERRLEHRSVQAILEKPLSATEILQHVARQLGHAGSGSGPAYPLPDPVTEIFQSEDYEVQSDDVEAGARTASLLDAFCDEIDSLVVAVTDPSSADAEATGRLLHKLAGTAGAGGAIYLAKTAGDLVKKLDAVDDLQALDWARLHAVWVMTRRHVKIFRGTLTTVATTPPGYRG